MIEYNTKTWFGHIVKFHKTDTLRRLLGEMFLVALYTAAVAAVEIYWLRGLRTNSGEDVVTVLQNTTVMHSILGFVLSLLVVFRTNTAYDRWWEGRKLWGSLVNNTRNLSIKINAMLPASCQDSKFFFRATIPSFVFAMKEHLRGGVKWEELELDQYLRVEIEDCDHVPNQIVQAMYSRTAKLHHNGDLTGGQLLGLDKNLNTMLDILGACERIRKTPIPFTYNIFLKKFIFFYIMTLPVGFVAYFDYWAIPISVFVFYVLVSLEIIAEEIEDPFGLDPNDLPTDKLAATIQSNVREIFDR